MAEVKIEPQNGDSNGISEIESKIIKQLEYYFSDINLGKDKFMKQEMMKNNGWIPLSVLLTFNRLKAITESEEVIVSALRKSNSGLILISENERQIKRDVETYPLPELTDEYKKQLNARTVHMKGFPLDAKYDDIHSYCSQFGEIESLEIRRTKDKTFKGCIFVVYKTVEEADKAAKDGQKFKDHVLLRENKIRYFERKSEFYHLREKRKRERKNKTKEEEESTIVPNALLKLTNVPKNIGFAKMKDVLNSYGAVSYVDIENDSTEAFVRFTDENGAQTALKKIQEKGAGDQVVIDENVVSVELVTGDEEKAFWKRISKIRSELKNKKEMSKKKKGRKNSRLKYHKRGQKRSGDEPDEVATKQIKKEVKEDVSEDIHVKQEVNVKQEDGD